MASLEDYDEFGNYIGADLGSEGEEEEAMETDFGQAPRHEPVPALEGYEEEPIQTEEAGALMEVEGELPLVSNEDIQGQLWKQNPSITLSFSTRTSSTILLLKKCMVLV